MLGEFLSRVLLLLFGYAMPAFECFKTVEARPNDAHMLRFWCQYWEHRPPERVVRCLAEQPPETPAPHGISPAPSPLPCFLARSRRPLAQALTASREATAAATPAGILRLFSSNSGTGSNPLYAGPWFCPAASHFTHNTNQQGNTGRIIVAMVIAVESFISWLPMYGEIKLAFFVYLWYPKTKGSDIVYDTFLRPMVMQYEPNIEQRLLHLRARSGQLLTFYIQNFADKGTAFFMDVLRSVVSDEPAASVSERNKKPSGWSPFATKRRPPSPPPPESIFGGPADLDAAPVAQVIRASMGAARPARRQYSGRY